MHLHLVASLMSWFASVVQGAATLIPQLHDRSFVVMIGLAGMVTGGAWIIGRAHGPLRDPGSGWRYRDWH